MSDPVYLPGSWFAVVSSRAVVLLEDSISPSRLQAVWNLCNGEPTLDELIEEVTGGRFVGAPFFGIGLVDGARLRVVVRSGVTAVVGESIGAARSIVSGKANTWVEETLDEPQSLRLMRDAGAFPTLTLPVQGGIVFADQVTWTPSKMSGEVPTADPIGRTSASHVSSTSEPPAASRPAPVSHLRSVAPPSGPFPTEPTVPMSQGVPLAPPAPAASPAPPDPFAPLDPPRPLVGEARPGPLDSPAEESPNLVSPSADPNDSDWSMWKLNEHGELGGSHRAEPDQAGSGGLGSEQQPLPGDVPAVPRDGLPPLLLEDQPESPLESRPRSRTRSAAGNSAPDSAPVVGEEIGLTMHGVPLLGAPLPAVPSPGRLLFSTGQIVELDRPVIVGRSPSADRVQRPDLPRLVRIDNLDQDISRNHVEIRVEGMQVLAVDLNSANGTIVTIPGRMPQRLVPQEPLLLLLGSIVTLSEEISFSYEVAE